MHLKTQRLSLRPIHPEDAQELFNYRSDAVTNKYQGWIPKTIDDAVIFIEKTAKEWNEPETWFQFVILVNENQQLIGDVGVHFFGNENQQVEIGCTLNKDFQHKGYATEALKCVIDYLFKEMNKHRIMTSVDPDNSRSIHLLERIGFRKEGHFVESYWDNGKWVDDCVYALLDKDWKILNP